MFISIFIYEKAFLFEMEIIFPFQRQKQFVFLTKCSVLRSVKDTVDEIRLPYIIPLNILADFTMYIWLIFRYSEPHWRPPQA
jgi:hypothetical protein